MTPRRSRFEVRVRCRLDRRVRGWLGVADASVLPSHTVLRLRVEDDGEIVEALRRLTERGLEVVSVSQVAEPSAADDARRLLRGEASG